MTPLTVARRYAHALYQEAERDGRTAQVDEDVAFLQDSFESSRQLVTFFESPIFSREKKEAVIRELFEERVQPLTFRFLMLLLEKSREDIFPATVRAYRELRDEQLNIAEATVRAAQPLSAEEEAKLVRSLEHMTGKRIRIRTEQDASLIGGVVIRVGDTVYDGSVRHQLDTLRERMERTALMPA
jgi:F-type H+-transporting ATPase subunit delta